MLNRAAGSNHQRRLIKSLDQLNGVSGGGSGHPPFLSSFDEDAAVFRANDTASRVHRLSPPPARGLAAARLSVGLVVATVTPRLFSSLISAYSHAGFLTPT